MAITLSEAITDEVRAVLEPLTIDQYHEMIRVGILAEGAPIELIDGLLVRKDRRDAGGDIMTVGPRHAHVVKRLVRNLNALLQDVNCHVQAQQPIVVTGISEPEPDVAVIRGSEDDYVRNHPDSRDVLLIVEVAHRSLLFDRGPKREIYASAGIPHYLIVNLKDDAVEHYSDPDPQEQVYRACVVAGRGESLVVETAGGAITISTDEVLGR